MTVLAARGVSKRFGGIQALKNVDIEFRAGEIHAVIGPNGSGKTTLLSILSGGQTADEGTIFVGDRELAAFRSPRAAGAAGVERMPQELALVGSMSVAENVVLGHEPARRGLLAARRTRAAAVRALEHLGLDFDVDQPAAMLPPSQQRLVMLARTLYRSATVVIADEPTAGLLPDDAHHVTTALAQAASKGLSIIYVSHHLDEVARIASRVTVLKDGQVVQRFAGAVDRETLLAQLMPEPAQTHVPASPASAGEVLLSVEGLSAGTVRKLDVQVRRHQIVGFAGLLGSGRDDALPAIVGEIASRAGDVTALDRAVSRPRSAVRAGIGYLCGDRTRSVLPGTSITGHVALPWLRVLSRFWFTDAVREERRVQAALDRVGVTASPAQQLTALSGGNQQRALLARWFVGSTQVLLVDEPAVGVDVAARASLLAELAGFAGHGAVLVASSDNEDLFEICHRILCFRDGEVVAVVERAPGWESVVSRAAT